MSVSTRRVNYHKSSVEACVRCCDKMNLIPAQTKTFPKNRTSSTNKSGGYGYKSKSGINDSKYLIENFSKKITNLRKKKQWSKEDLAKKAGVRLIDVKNIESGKVLEDKVVHKLEKALDFELFTEENHPDVRKVRPTGGTGMTLGDFFDN